MLTFGGGYFGEKVVAAGCVVVGPKLIGLKATAQAIIILFAGLCLLAAMGLPARWFAVFSAVLCLTLAFVV
ncbi:MAG: hypothetical protein GKR98_10275 [Boseongicola sp.]|nr:MAG: hypothetical protein GKR98_10275 [Boseongicola sp.]